MSSSGSFGTEEEEEEEKKGRMPACNTAANVSLFSAQSNWQDKARALLTANGCWLVTPGYTSRYVCVVHSVHSLHSPYNSSDERLRRTDEPGCHKDATDTDIQLHNSISRFCLKQQQQHPCTSPPPETGLHIKQHCWLATRYNRSNNNRHTRK